VSAIAGAALAGRLSDLTLRRIFAAFLVLAALRLISARRAARAPT
jgi:uncharacterized membrane protein YfcA